jgi:hypothetical protein
MVKTLGCTKPASLKGPSPAQPIPFCCGRRLTETPKPKRTAGWDGTGPPLAPGRRRRVYSPVAPTRGWPLATSAPTFCVTPSSGLSHQSSSSAAGPRSSSNVPSAPRNGQPISRCSHEAKKKRKRKAGWMEVSHGDVLQHQASLVQTWRGAGTDGIAITLNQLILYKHPSC